MAMAADGCQDAMHDARCCAGEQREIEMRGWKEGQKDKLKDEAVRLSMTGRNANRHSDIVNSKVDSWYMYDMLKNSFSDGRRSKRKNDIII